MNLIVVSIVTAHVLAYPCGKLVMEGFATGSYLPLFICVNNSRNALKLGLREREKRVMSLCMYSITISVFTLTLLFLDMPINAYTCVGMSLECQIRMRIDKVICFEDITLVNTKVYKVCIYYRFKSLSGCNKQRQVIN